MKVILSPAKNIKIRKFENIDIKQPIFKNEILEIIEKLKKYEPYELESLMKINPEIALNTFFNISDFDIKNIGGHALASYDGLVFKNINPIDFNKEEILFAENMILILSGLYGLLTPCTNIIKYRLEMQCKIEIHNNKNLYKFWDNKIYNELYKNTDTVLNLASKEYYKTITPFLKNNQKFITVDFLVNKNGKHKVIATSAKIARGQMTRYIIKNKIDRIEDIKEFTFDNYIYNEYLSSNENIVFLKNNI